ncbi:hypothetical protein NQ318_014348, partial [Aromia moschata]
SPGIIAFINDWADNTFKHVQKLIIRHGLDPVELPDETLKLFPTGTISLSTGWLEDTSTVKRYKDVWLDYRSATKKLTLTIPIQFEALMFIYKYHTKVTLLDISGDTQGKISDLRANVELTFDFTNYEASLTEFDIKDSGSISLTFSGNGLVDWLTSNMTTVITYFLHPVILRIIEFIVKGGMEAGVKVVNEHISSILRNETVATENYLYV